MTDEFDFSKVEVLRGHNLDDPTTTRFYLNAHGSDGSEMIIDDKLSHADAMIAALECGIPIIDNTGLPKI